MFATAELCRSLAVSVLALGLVVGCAASTPTSYPTTSLKPTDEAESWSVLLITVDNLRPDHMSVYGYDKPTTPHLERFAKEAAVFESAFSTSAWTAPGMVSIFTGYYPSVHAQSGRFSYYDSEMASALRVLAEEGYETFGEAIEGPSHEDFGFERVTGKLEDFIETRVSSDERYFAWSHLRDVHLPYTPSARNAKRFGATSRESEGTEAVANHKVILRYPDEVQLEFEHAGRVAFDQEDISEVRALYDGEVADVDERLGRILERMRETGLLDRTIVIITADHGEELFEHGWIGHASTGYDGKLYDELIRIPLLIRVPDGSVTGRTDALAQGVDIMPTILDILHIPDAQMHPPMQGRSLLPLITSAAAKVRDFAFAQTTLKGWTTPKEEIGVRVITARSTTQKLIWFPTENGFRVEGFDLREDPGEKNNLYPRHALEFRYLEQAMETWTTGNRRAAAELVFDASDRRLTNIAIAVLGAGGLAVAEEQRSAIRSIGATWALEPDGLFSHAPYAERWRGVQRLATEMIDSAVDCRDKGGTLSTGAPATPLQVEAWTCIDGPDPGDAATPGRE